MPSGLTGMSRDCPRGAVVIAFFNSSIFLFASVTTTLLTYFVFTYLGLLFPDGIIKLQGVIP